MSFEFALGTEQLMGVLPVVSREQIPAAYQVHILSLVCLTVLSPVSEVLSDSRI